LGPLASVDGATAPESSTDNFSPWGFFLGRLLNPQMVLSLPDHQNDLTNHCPVWLLAYALPHCMEKHGLIFEDFSARQILQGV
jgi:hypothetical protein